MEDKGISHEEIIALKPVSMAFCAANKVRVGVKTITFGAQEYSTEVKFQRGVAHTGTPDFMIEVQEEEKIMVKCSLGHDHETGRVKKKWGRIQLSWDQAGQLMEWFQTGDWKKVREDRKRLTEKINKFKETQYGKGTGSL